MSIYLKVDGIDGTVTQDGYEKWIEVGSLQWGSGRGIATPVGATANREGGQASVSEVTVTKEMDSSSPSLFTASVAGDAGKEVKIHLVTTSDPGRTYVEYTLENSLLSGYSVSSGGDRPSESISINFTKIEFKFNPLESDNSEGDPITVSYDLSTGKTG